MARRPAAASATPAVSSATPTASAAIPTALAAAPVASPELTRVRHDLDALRAVVESDRARLVELALTLDREFIEMRNINEELEETMRAIAERAAGDSRRLKESLADLVEREHNRRHSRFCSVM
jgi:hypothetical protein